MCLPPVAGWKRRGAVQFLKPIDTIGRQPVSAASAFSGDHNVSRPGMTLQNMIGAQHPVTGSP